MNSLAAEQKEEGQRACRSPGRTRRARRNLSDTCRAGPGGPHSNMNAFRAGLAAIQKRREAGIPTAYKETQTADSRRLGGFVGAGNSKLKEQSLQSLG